MKTADTIVLKLTGIIATILYGWSLLWITMLYLYGGLYYPIRKLGLAKSIYFEIFVAVLSLSIIGLIVLKLKGHTFWNLLFQDFVLIVISFPFFGLLFESFNYTLNLSGDIYIALLTVLTININDWLKTSKGSR